MINKIAYCFENIAKQLGISIKIPRPGRTGINISMLINGIAGIVLIISGVVLRKISLMLIGALGIAGVVLLVLDRGRGNETIGQTV